MIRLNRRQMAGLAGIIICAPQMAIAKSCGKDLIGRPLMWRLDTLDANRARLRQDNTGLKPALTALIMEADIALTRGPFSVTDKERPPPSGDRHDYTSLAPYWWPDPNRETGRPYVRRDGEVNPERNGPDFDKIRMSQLIKDVTTLGLAYYFTSDQRYSDHAAILLDTWFNYPDTRMNPNLNYGQSIPGRTDGRGIGIIDTHKMGELIDAVQLLARDGGITARTYQGVRLWFRDYTEWLMTSPLGQDERAAKNNHGTYYDLQVIHFALFFGDCSFAEARLKDTKKRVDAQISPFGRMPLEETRTRSLHYYVFNAQAFLGVAELARHFGGKFHEYEGRRGQSLRKVLTYLAQFSASSKSWPHQQIGRSSQPDLAYLMQWAAPYFPDKVIQDAARRSRPLIENTPQALLLPTGVKHTDSP